jgi:Nucleotidyl transferase AbiEii toxin, Type IV TA system
VTPRLAGEYTAALTGASRAGLLELGRTLRAYRESLVLVGGWVPYLLIERNKPSPSDFLHVGSIDIDFVVDPNRIGPDEYATIVELITQVGWEPCEGKRFSFERTVDGSDGVPYEINVDFLTSEATGGGRSRRHRPVQLDLQARTMRGAELALSHREGVVLSGKLPGGASSEAEVRMLDVAGCVGTKAIALGERYKQKDAYDLVSVIDRYGTGVEQVAELVRSSSGEELLAEALDQLRNKFQSATSEGPVWYSEFLGGDSDARDRSAQRAFQVVEKFNRLVS